MSYYSLSRYQNNDFAGRDVKIEGVRGVWKVVSTNILIYQYGGQELLTMFHETKGGGPSRVIEALESTNKGTKPVCS